MVNLGIKKSLIGSSKHPAVKFFNNSLMDIVKTKDILIGIAMFGMIEERYAEISMILVNHLIQNEWLTEKKLVHYSIHKDIDKPLFSKSKFEHWEDIYSKINNVKDQNIDDYSGISKITNNLIFNVGSNGKINNKTDFDTLVRNKYIWMYGRNKEFIARIRVTNKLTKTGITNVYLENGTNLDNASDSQIDSDNRNQVGTDQLTSSRNISAYQKTMITIGEHITPGIYEINLDGSILRDVNWKSVFTTNAITFVDDNLPWNSSDLYDASNDDVDPLDYLNNDGSMSLSADGTRIAIGKIDYNNPGARSPDSY